MSVWLGQLGSMVETLCASDLPVETEDRWLWAGGAGTLAPSEALMVSSFGGGARSWRFSSDVHRPHEESGLASLARAQRRSGGALRFVPCNAPFMNMLTPGASEEFAGWSGVTAGMVSGPVVATEAVEPVKVYPAVSVRVPAGQAITSPVVPLVGDPSIALSAVFSAFVQRTGGLGTLEVSRQAVSVAGTIVRSSTTSVSTSSAMARQLWDFGAAPHPDAVGLRVRLTPSVEHVLAWPAITIGPGRHWWVLGQCADGVVLSPPSSAPTLLTPDRSLTATGYTAREVHV